MLFIVSFYYFVDQGCGGCEFYGQFFLVCSQVEIKGDVCFVCVVGIKSYDVFMVFDLFVVCQFQYLYFVEFWYGGEVEVVEVFDDWEFCCFDVVFDFVVILFDYFLFCKMGKVFGMIYVFGGVLLGQFLVFLQEGWQFQGFEMVGKQDFGGCIRCFGVYVVFFVLVLLSRFIQVFVEVFLIFVFGKQGQIDRFSFGGWCFI